MNGKPSRAMLYSGTKQNVLQAAVHMVRLVDIVLTEMSLQFKKEAQRGASKGGNGSLQPWQRPHPIRSARLASFGGMLSNSFLPLLFIWMDRKDRLRLRHAPRPGHGLPIVGARTHRLSQLLKVQERVEGWPSMCSPLSRCCSSCSCWHLLTSLQHS